MLKVPFYDTMAFDLASLSFHSAVLIIYVPFAFLSFRRFKLECYAQMIILIFLLTFMIRAASAAMLLDEGFKTKKT
jgi:hypothetical protein